MRFSVVIPLYNKEHYIKNTLYSLLNQSFSDFEILVVDDGSTDDSLSIVRKIHSEKIRIICQRNQGVSVARNTGIQEADGEYVAFLDADDEWMPDYLETIDNLIDSYPESDLYVTAYSVNFGRRKKISTLLKPEKGCLDSYWLTLAKGYDFVWTSVTTVRRRALLDAGCFKPGEKVGQDLDMWARIARKNPRVAYSSKICAVYNRMAEANARTRIPIAYARAFLQDLEEELNNPIRTKEEKISIQRKYDKKMTVYIFTCILSGEKQRAEKELKRWAGTKNFYNKVLRMGLLFSKGMPSSVNRGLYKIRLKIF